MKPFDLKKALDGDPVVTRDGQRVLNIAYLPDATPYMRVAAVVKTASVNYVFMYSERGTIYENSSMDFDLFMAPVEREYWIATGKGSNTGGLLGTKPVDSEEGIKRLVQGTGLDPKTIQYHKIKRID
jgi:hypothetical protein